MLLPFISGSRDASFSRLEKVRTDRGLWLFDCREIQASEKIQPNSQYRECFCAFKVRQRKEAFLPACVRELCDLCLTVQLDIDQVVWLLLKVRNPTLNWAKSCQVDKPNRSQNVSPYIQRLLQSSVNSSNKSQDENGLESITHVTIARSRSWRVLAWSPVPEKIRHK